MIYHACCNLIDVTHDPLITYMSPNFLSLNRSFRSHSPRLIDFKMSSDIVPFFDSLSSIYDATILEEQTRRYQQLYNQFINLYNIPPSHIVRAPGRVNLIVSSITSTG